MGAGIAEMLFREPPEDWTLTQFDEYIERLINMYKPVYLFMKMQDKERFDLAESLHERIWVFRDARRVKFPDNLDKWMLVDF
jgi:hypothetical protein